jgi:hypothetical protein
MGKDISRKTRGSWWIGWVRVACTGDVFGPGEFTRHTDWEFATAAQAHRAAEALAGSLATEDRLTVIDIGARRSS